MDRSAGRSELYRTLKQGDSFVISARAESSVSPVEGLVCRVGRLTQGNYPQGQHKKGTTYHFSVIVPGGRLESPENSWCGTGSAIITRRLFALRLWALTVDQLLLPVVLPSAGDAEPLGQ